MAENDRWLLLNGRRLRKDRRSGKKRGEREEEKGSWAHPYSLAIEPRRLCENKD
jgi:hypothetical protein